MKNDDYEEKTIVLQAAEEFARCNLSFISFPSKYLLRMKSLSWVRSWLHNEYEILFKLTQLILVHGFVLLSALINYCRFKGDDAAL